MLIRDPSPPSHGPRHLAAAPGTTTVELTLARKRYNGRHRADEPRQHHATQVIPTVAGVTISRHTSVMSQEEIARLVARRQPVERPYAVGKARLPTMVVVNE